MNIIKAVFGRSAFTKTPAVFQWDGDDKLVFENVDLPETYQVHFANSLNGESKKAIGRIDGVTIPWEFFVPGSNIYAWIWLPSDNGSGYTKYQVTIPVYSRARPTDAPPTPPQQSALDQAIAALNEATEEIPNQINTALAEAKASGEFDGEDGAPGVGVPSTDGHSPGELLELYRLISGKVEPVWMANRFPKIFHFDVNENGAVTTGPSWSEVLLESANKTVIAEVSTPVFRFNEQTSIGTETVYLLGVCHQDINGRLPVQISFTGVYDGTIRVIKNAPVVRDSWVYESVLINEGTDIEHPIYIYNLYADPVEGDDPNYIEFSDTGSDFASVGLVLQHLIDIGDGQKKSVYIILHVGEQNVLLQVANWHYVNASDWSMEFQGRVNDYIVRCAIANGEMLWDIRAYSDEYHAAFKVDKYQGFDNIGKVMYVDEDGNVQPIDISELVDSLDNESF